MIVQTVACRGIGPFRSPVALDFTSIPAGSVIMCLGTNGAGKTTLIECMGFGAPFREFPSYRDPKGTKGESLASHVPPDVRDAFLEVAYLLHDRPVRLRVEIDGKRRKTEAYIAWDGQTRGPLGSEVDEIVAQLFASRDLMLVGPFACQGGFDGFFRRGPGDRKAIFAEIIRAGHLEVLAERAGEDEQATLADLATVREGLVRLRGRVELLGQRRTELERAAAAVDGAALDVATMRARLDAAEGAHRSAREARVRAEATDAERERVVGELAAADRRYREAVSRLDTLERLRAEGPVIRAAADRIVAIDAELLTARAAEQAVSERLPRLEAAVATATAERDRLLADYRRVDGERAAAAAASERITALVLVETRQTEVKAARDRQTAALAEHDEGGPALVTAIEQAEAALVAHEATATAIIDAAAAETQTVLRRRELRTRRDDLTRRNALLAGIPNVPECGACPLTTDLRQEVDTLSAIDAELVALPSTDGLPADAALQAYHAARANLERAVVAARRAERDWSTLRRELDDRRRRSETELAEIAQQLANAAGDRAAAARLDALTTETTTLVAQGTAARRALDEATTAHTGAAAERQRLRDQVADLERTRATHAITAARLPELAAADAQHAEVTALRDTADRDRTDLMTTLAALPEGTLDDADARVATALQGRDDAAAAVTNAEGAHAAAVRTHAGLEAEVSAFGDPDAEVATLTTREAALVTAAADCAVLKRALGNRGVQALLIDAVGPEVSAIANELLAANYTPRFQIALTTTQPRADGKGVTEVFDARILDAEAGRDGTRGSGGETALIDAALRLATTIVNVRRSGCDTRTLFLDEPTAALSQENAPKYVRMIRHAMRIGGFHHAFLVTHEAEIWEQGDARILVEDGAARLVVPGAVAA